MNIAITIIVNLIIASILFVGVMKGRRYGFKYELPKLLILLGVLTGMFFLTPIINEKVLTLSIVQELITRFAGLDKLVYILILVLPIFIVYALISLILRLIRKSSDKKVLMNSNRARKGHVKSIDKKINRQIKREDRKEFRKQRKTIKIGTFQRLGGMVCGLFIAILLCFCISLPVKHITKSIVQAQENLSIVETIHNNSIFGIIDNKVIDFDNCIISK